MLGKAPMNTHLMREHNQGMPMPHIDANRTYFRNLFVATCDKEKKPPDEETGHTLREWRIDSEVEPIPILAGLFPVFGFAAKSYEAEFNQHRIYGL